MAKPFKGIFQDCNPVDQPEGTYRDARNMLYNKLRDSICNEGGFELKQSLPDNAIFYGSIRLSESDLVIYGLNNIIRFGEFKNGILNTNNAIQINNNLLNLSEHSPIKGIYVNNYKGERIVIWIDGINTPKILNIDTQPQFVVSNSYLLELFPKGNMPVINNITVNNTGGSLLTGSYAFSLAYVLDDDSETNYYNISDYAHIFKASTSTNNNTFAGNDVEVVTPKSITLNLTGLDTSYKKVSLAIVKYISGNITVEKIKYNYSGTSKTIVYTGNENTEDILIEELLSKRSSYDSASAITYSNKKLYLANLTKNIFPDYKEYAANITANWTFDETVSLNTVAGSHKDATTILLKKSFMPDEVYAFWIAFHLKDGTQSPAFHIPGREAIGSDSTYISDLTDTYSYLSDDLTISPTIKYFHTRDTSLSDGTMSYWENENEIYEGYSDLSGNVRHHKFPSLSKLIEYEDEWINIPTSNDILISIDGTDVSDFSEHQLEDFDYFSLSLVYGATIATSDCTVDILVQHKNSNGDVVNTILSETFLESANDSITYDFSNTYSGTLEITATIFNGTINDEVYIEGSLNVNKKTQAKLLGIRFKDIVIPEEIQDIATGYEIFYTKRNEFNSTVVAQSLLFKENTTINTIDNIAKDSQFAIHPADLLKNQEYPGVNPSYIKYQATISDIGTASDYNNKYLSPLQSYSTFNIFSTREILPIENVEYVPYLNEDKKETRLVGTAKQDVICVVSDVRYAYLSNLCNYLPDIYVDSTFLVSTGKVFSLDTSDTSDMYKGDMFITEYGLRTTPEYNNDFGETNFGKRLSYGSFSFACFNRCNTGLRLEGDNFAETFYPKTNIITTPTLFNHFSDVWGEALLENETPDNFDNYLVINNDLYRQNDLNNVQPQNDEELIDNYPNLIIQSESVQYDSKGGAIRTFLPLNYYELPKDKGSIINLASKSKDVIIHTEDSIYRTVSEVRLDPSQSNVVLGSGKIFDIDPDEIFPVTGGYAGTQNWTSCFMTKAGYFFVDNRRKKIFLMSDKLEEISNYGMKTFFEENLGFRINEQLIAKGEDSLTASNPNSKYGIGYVVGFDDKYNRIIFTKRDFSISLPYIGQLTNSGNRAKYLNIYLYPEINHPSVTNKSFTISYSLETQSWSSFHDYHPQWWLYNFTTPFTFFDGKIYSFNKDYYNGIYYNDSGKIESSIQFIFNEQPTVNKLLFNVSWDSIFIDNIGVIDNNTTFDKIEIRNSENTTGEVELTIGNPNDYKNTDANIARKTGVWNFNSIVTNHSDYKQQKRFIDKYNSVRLINANTTENILYLSNIDVRQRLSQF